MVYVEELAYYVSATVIAAYFVVVSIGFVRSVEKQSIIQRFGLQTPRTAMLVFLVAVSVVLTSFLNDADWNAVVPVVLAPIPEELFFRGYILGGFRKWVRIGRRLDWLKMMAGPVLLSSAIFGISHVFRNYPLSHVLTALTFGIVEGVLYLLTESIMIPSALHTLSNFIILEKMLYPPTIVIPLSIVIVIPPCVVLMAETVKKVRAEAISPIV